MPCISRPSFILIVSLCLLPVAGRAAREEKWLKIETPAFTLYSDNSEAETRAWAAKFEEFRIVMGDTLHLTPTQLPPAQIMIFHGDAALTPFKPKNRAKSTHPDAQLVGFAINNQLMTGITLSFENLDDESGFAIFYGGAGWFLNGLQTPGPDWFRGGFADIFSVFTSNGNEAVAGARRPQHSDWIADHGLMPLDQFFARSAAAKAPEGDLVSDYEAECWALVHYLLWGRGPQGAEQLKRYLANPGDGSAARFTQAFDTTLPRMQEELRAYIRGGRSHATHIKYDQAALAKSFQVSAAIPLEIQVAKGYVLLLGDDREGANGYFARANGLAPGNPKVAEALGNAAFIMADTERALDKWKAAIEAGSRNFQVYYRLADTLLRNTRGFGSERPGEVNPRLGREVADYLERAIELNPGYTPSWGYLPYVLAYYAEPTPADARFLELGLQRFPGDPLMEAGAAAVELKSGRTAAAKERLDRLTAGGQPLPAFAAGIVKFVQEQLEFSNGLGEVERLVAGGKLEEADELIGRLLGSPMPPDIRRQLSEHRTYVALLQLLQQADAAIAEGRWSEADILVHSVMESASDPELQAQAKKRLDEIVRRRTDKKT